MKILEIIYLVVMAVIVFGIIRNIKTLRASSDSKVYYKNVGPLVMTFSLLVLAGGLANRYWGFSPHLAAPLILYGLLGGAILLALVLPSRSA
jgi:tellurite resistance protein TehA-like permease